MSEVKELPKGWKFVSLGDVAAVNPKIPNKEQIADDMAVQFLPMKLVEEVSGKIHLTEIKKYGEVKKGYTPFINGDVIFAKVTPCMENGKIAQVYNLKNGIGFGSSEFHVIRNSDKLSGKYIFYYLVQQRFRREAEAQMTGAVGLRRVPKQFLEGYPIPLPPPSIQSAIVSKIEELFSELDKGIESLRIAQQQLRTYRQSVLKWAFDGLKETTFETIIAGSQNGISKRSGRDGIEYKVLRLADITKGVIDNSSPRTIKLDKSEVEKYKIKVDDLVCIRVNGSKDLVGKLVFVSKENEKESWAYCDHFIRFSLNADMAVSKFYYYYFITLKVRKYIQDNMVTSAGQNTVSQGTIKNVPVPICTIKEQQQIVEEIERRLTVADKMEESISQSLLQAEAMRQSILKMAFEGRLVM